MSCPQCGGTGWRKTPGDSVHRMKRCRCWRERVDRDRLAAARIPPRYRGCDLATFVTYDNPRLLRAVEHSRRFVEAFPVVEKGLLLIGPPGIGKTHIAIAVLRQLVAEKGVRGLYYDTRGLLDAIRSTFDRETRGSRTAALRPVLDAELLVLDDLGAERSTEWVEETLNSIVNSRYNDRRATIFTSNYEDSPDPDALDSLSARVGFRMHSRLRGMCEFLEYDGPDYRDFEFTPTGEELARIWKAGARRKLPARTTSRARARLQGGDAGLGWSGGRSGA